MSDDYFQVILLIERLHRQFLDVVKLELDALRVHDVNNVQALMLFNMGDAEISVGELTMRGYYLGSKSPTTSRNCPRVAISWPSAQCMSAGRSAFD